VTKVASGSIPAILRVVNERLHGVESCQSPAPRATWPPGRHVAAPDIDERRQIGDCKVALQLPLLGRELTAA
jgi:hypothetical protein